MAYAYRAKGAFRCAGAAAGALCLHNIGRYFLLPAGTDGSVRAHLYTKLTGGTLILVDDSLSRIQLNPVPVQDNSSPCSRGACLCDTVFNILGSFNTAGKEYASCCGIYRHQLGVAFRKEAVACPGNGQKLSEVFAVFPGFQPD